MASTDDVRNEASQLAHPAEAASREAMKTELVALKGKLFTHSFCINEGARLVIGRGQDVDIQILDTGLSRKQCALEKKNDAFYLVDLDSRNGTFVNDERITRKLLAPGDRVRIGGIEFQFRSEPDRRRMQADLIASIPEMPGRELKQRVAVDASELMQLPSKFQSLENFRRIQQDLATIYRVGNLISAEADPVSLYERILDAIFLVVPADRGFLILERRKDGVLEAVAHRVRAGADLEKAGTGFSHTIVKEVLRDGTCVLRANALTDEHYGQAESVISLNIHSVICVPVETPDRVVGAIYADTVGESEAFTKHDIELLAAVGKQGGVAIHRAQLAEQVRDMLRGTVRALVLTIEAKDDYTRGHSERVTAYALKIGRAIGLNESQLRTLELGGFLHDVGKIGVPENILRKAGPLTEEEYAIVKQHPSIGERIIRNIDGAEQIAEVVLHHHERWDGTGYPDKLAEDGASLLARILTVADACDAMSSKRPYRDRLAWEKVIEEMKRGARKQFDPDIVDIFVRESQEGRVFFDDKQA